MKADIACFATLDIVNEEYFLSERIIHDQLLDEAERGINTLYDSFKENKSIPPFALFWPATLVESNDGGMVGDTVLLELERFERERWRSILIEGLRKTNAYGILLAEQKEGRVEVTFETVHGSRRWTLPITRRLGTPVLGRPTVETDVEGLQLLWAPQKDEA